MAAAKAPRSFLSRFVCQSCRQQQQQQHRVPAYRPFSSTSAAREDRDNTSTPVTGLTGDSSSTSSPSSPSSSWTAPSPVNSFASSLLGTRRSPSDSFSSILDSTQSTSSNTYLPGNLKYMPKIQGYEHEDKPHRLHIYAHKHNTHITFVQPAKPASQTVSSGISGTSSSAASQNKKIDVLLSLSTGNIGFRKAGRGSYDAAYQLAAFVLKQIQDKGMIRDVRQLEVVLRGFGAGREAVTKVLLGAEGRHIRGRITSVVDATRLKQGGPRSKKPRRLG